MSRPQPDAVKRVACIGTGVIGGGWVAYFLSRGYEVRAWDPGEGAEAALQILLDNAWSSLEELGLAEGASRDNLTFFDDMAAALEGVDFVQESAPERLDLKIKLLADIDRALDQGIVVSSSTSGYAMSEMQGDCQTPGRFVVGHPFNPPYLIPLVEIVGGEQTDQDAVDWSADFFEHAGKSVIKMKTELPGFIANRLQEALWREALHMVAAGEATVEEIDASIAEGPGLRWAIMGPCLTFHLAGGEGGMGHMLDHFGPCLEYPWTRLKSPELTTELRDRMVDGCLEEAGERSVSDLVRERDRALVAILKAR
jgi:carnitine 3-dehydrogenase